VGRLLKIPGVGRPIRPLNPMAKRESSLPVIPAEGGYYDGKHKALEMNE
jgi:hypothetical protein